MSVGCGVWIVRKESLSTRRSWSARTAFVLLASFGVLLSLGCATSEDPDSAARAAETPSVVTIVVTSTVEQLDEEKVTTSEAEEGGESSPKAEQPIPALTPRLRAARVSRVVDGDTVELANGKTVRLVQIDTPEDRGECYGREASSALATLLPPGTRISLERDPALDNVDRYGRLLRYVHKGPRNINLVLVRRGVASVWFYDGAHGRYADQLLSAARKAKARKRGAWGACRAMLDPTSGFETQPKSSQSGAVGGGSSEGECMADYDPCLPISGDLDCPDVRALGKAPVRITGADPYRLDGDGDGWGCE